MRIRTGSIVHDVGAVLITLLAGLIGMFGILLLENPMLTRSISRASFINLLLLAYALPRC